MTHRFLVRKGQKQISSQGESINISRYLNFETSVRNLIGDIDYTVGDKKTEAILGRDLILEII